MIVINHDYIFIYFLIGDYRWECVQSSSSDDELSPINESVGPDHLTRDK